jgi:uncharacterized protein
MKGKRETIWIDLENSPHVPFFKPIIKELEKRGYEIIVTARDCFQVCELAELHQLTYHRVGRHYGKRMLLKALGLLIRAVQMAPLVISKRPKLALSHGSRSQVLLAKVLRIPSVMMFDYEHVEKGLLLKADLLMVPELIAGYVQHASTCSYPGIKEDVYVPNFEPHPGILRELGIAEGEIVVTVRPPATEAHYFKPASEELFEAAIDWLTTLPAARIVMLPRNDHQGKAIRARWPGLVDSGKILLPPVVDGLNLIWHSDIVISGGGTMNREAAALGVPVYSIFRGESGAVDRYLAEQGRLTFLKNVDQMRQVMRLGKWQRPMKLDAGNRPALQHIVNSIERMLANR